MAYVLFGFSLLLALAVYGANHWVFETEVTLYAIALAIAMILEGLVAVISLTLSIGVKRMAKHKVIYHCFPSRSPLVIMRVLLY